MSQGHPKLQADSATVIVTNAPSQSPIGAQSSTQSRWSLRRIEKRLFPRRDASQQPFYRPARSPLTTQQTFTPQSYSRCTETAKVAANISSAESRPSPASIPLQLAPARERSRGPPESQNPTPFGLMKRTFSKSRNKTKLTPFVPNAPIGEQETPDQRNRGEEFGKSAPKPVTPHDSGEAPILMQLQHPEQHRDSLEPIEVHVAAVGTRCASGQDAANTMGALQKRVFASTEDKEVCYGPSTAYIPKHAAIDFSRLHVASDIQFSDPVMLAPFSIDEPTPNHAILRESEQNLTDFQKFLRAARKADLHARIAYYTLDKTSSLSVSRILDQKMEPLCATSRERWISMSSRPTNSRPDSRRHSFIEVLGDYIKPKTSRSVYSQSTAYHSFGNGGSSLRKSALTQKESPDSRWSKVVGLSRTSWLGEPDNNAGGKAENGAVRNRNGKIMPIAPALKK